MTGVGVTILVAASAATAPANAASATSRGALRAVSCPAAEFCAAVGEEPAPTPGSQQLLLETRSSGTWSHVTLNRATLYAAMAESVSCASTVSCVVVGSHGFDDASHSPVEVPFSLVYDGDGWTQVDGSPVGQYSGFDEVGCASSTSCIAVGHSVVNGRPRVLAQRWDGSSWSPFASPKLPPGTTFVSWTGISCALPTSCVATAQGQAADGHGRAVVDVLATTTWSVPAAAVPSGTDVTASSVDAVSCRSSTSCTAVGSVLSDGVPHPFLDQSKGRKWSQTTFDADGGFVQPSGVSCVSTACMIAGTLELDAAHNVAYAEVRTDDGQRTATNPARPGLASLFNGVSCWTPAGCVAVGQVLLKRTTRGDVYETLAETWNGTSWSRDVT